MPQFTEVAEFLAKGESLLLDARSPSEYSRAHVPGAVSFPLFSDEERAEVGTIYKQVGPQEALLRGLEFVGPRMAEFIREANRLNPDRLPMRMYCFRGGQRSQSLAWLLEKGGFEVDLLQGGYKAYRRHVLASFDETQEVLVLSGCTGSAKTRILHALQELGEQVIDLEGLACHRGSAFGGYEQPDDLTSEMVENRLYSEWSKLDRTRRVWLEDEGRNLGRVYLPDGFWKQLRQAPVIFIDIPFEERVKFLVQEYGHFDHDLLSGSVDRIAKRLGPQNHAMCREAVDAGDYAEVVRITLRYYDKAYRYNLEKRAPEPLFELELPEIEVERNARRLVEFADQCLPSASRSLEALK